MFSQGRSTQAPCRRRVASAKLRMTVGFKIWANQKVRFHNDEGQVCGLGFQVADVERSLISASQLAAPGFRVTFKAQGGEIEHIKTGRKMTLATRFLCLVRPEDQLTSSSMEGGVRSGTQEQDEIREHSVSEPATDLAEEEGQSEEEAPAALRDPRDPTAAGRAIHKATHLPFRLRMRSCFMVFAFLLRLRAHHGFTRKGQVCVEKGGGLLHQSPPFPCDPYRSSRRHPNLQPQADNVGDLPTSRPLGTPWATCPSAGDTPASHPLATYSMHF